ncbi:MAG: hypothetical protein K9M54_08200 [Kiritimatiellales bacterium]|nr:hypothetical protein [Kiritimatiellales bacterium]MCF7864732.1 hypothetical protein [Kiritimatiellales bacterium]
MRLGKHILYLMAWLAYAALSYALFPELKITVMLFSIPLTMLGGWLYTYTGALTTTLLTIPFHYLLLKHYSNAPDIVREVFNPFGIGTQLCFSLSTALLKATQQRYERLNSTLEEIVEQRTQSLRQLTNHLLQSEDMEIVLAETAMIDESSRQLKEMLETSKCLEQQLKVAKHPDCETAGTVARMIGTAIEQLDILEIGLRQRFQVPKKTYTSIQQLTDEFAHLAGDTVNINVEGKWETISHDVLQTLGPIVHQALSNAFRHANPSNITIGMQINPRTLVVTVENDGKSLPPSINEGMGIPLMRYRARRMGATLTIHSGKDKNTIIQCVIPNSVQ